MNDGYTRARWQAPTPTPVKKAPVCTFEGATCDVCKKVTPVITVGSSNACTACLGSLASFLNKQYFAWLKDQASSRPRR